MSASINITEERLLRLSEVPKRLPKGRHGRKLHVSTVYRWVSRGCQGVRLATIRIGGTTYTSLEALQRFCDRLSEPEPPEAPPPTRRSRRPAKSHEQASRLLDEAGI